MASSPFRKKKFLFTTLGVILGLSFLISIVPFFHDVFEMKEGDFTATAGDRTDLSNILFGVGGSVKTWHHRRQFCQLWWKFNVTRGFIWLEKKPPDYQNWPAFLPPYKISADTLGFRYTARGPRSAVRMALIVKESFELGLDNVRWFVMGDDDTIFFLENLVTVLNKYDHNQMYYIGANSESVVQNLMHSYGMAFGGGGFAVSYPLAAELVRVLDGCINRYASFYGSDEKVHSCMVEIGVPLTKEHGFHQMDITGDPYGLLAAHPLAPLVSLHHLDQMRSIFPGMSKLQSLKHLIHAYQTDPSRILQRSFCYELTKNWSISVSWGYTVQLHQSILTPRQLEAALLTFQPTRGGDSTFDTRRTIGSDPVLYFFDGVERVDGGIMTRTTYRRKQFSEPKKESEAVPKVLNVLASTFNPITCQTVPRRQCCEVVKHEDDDTQGVIHIEIRSCHRFETIIPASLI